jgi:RNA polymerase sigma factor (TIGR02999 family)
LRATRTNQLTQLLDAVGRGDDEARRRLWTLIYDELHRLAAAQIAAHPFPRQHATSLVHETYIRLSGGEPIQWADRRHFFSAAAQIMRYVRIDNVRRRMTRKRGGPAKFAKLSAGEPSAENAAEVTCDGLDLLALDDALTRLAERSARQAEIVNLRYFVGLSIDETASMLGVSPRQVDKEWRFARAWLHRQLA